MDKGRRGEGVRAWLQCVAQSILKRPGTRAIVRGTLFAPFESESRGPDKPQAKHLLLGLGVSRTTCRKR